MYYLFLICILTYVIYNMIETGAVFLISGSYLDRGPPIAGSVRLTAQFTNSSDSAPDYCSPGPFNPDGCLYWSPEQILYPYAGELNSIFVTTRVSVYQAPPPNGTCNWKLPSSTQCKFPSLSQLQATKKVYYIADVENLTFQVDHSVRTQSSLSYGSVSYKTSTSQEMTGKLISSCGSNEPLMEFDDRYRRNNVFGTELDVISMKQLLKATGCNDTFSLHDASNSPGAKAGEDLRSAGMVISSPISYSNREIPSQLQYQYLPVIINGTEYKITQIEHNPGGSATIYVRHGIKVIFAQTGSIGIFNPFALILNFVAALALMNVANTIVETLMLYVMPNRKLYYDAKYQETEDLADEANLEDGSIWPKDEM